MTDDDDDPWPESTLGSQKGDYDVPIGISPEGIPIYEPSPALLAMLERIEGQCVMMALGGCGGEIAERKQGRMVIRLCDAHADGRPGVAED